MRRDIQHKLGQWHSDSDRKPLILRGARQVGKTTELLKFAKTTFSNYLYLNFEDTPKLHSIFEKDLDPTRILKVLSLDNDMSIEPNNTLILFDEVQQCPRALNSLKYFCERANEYAICAAGSLLGVTMAQQAGFPVGKVNFLDMFPMSFFEFLEALGHANLREFLESINVLEPIDDLLHDKLTGLFIEFLLTGGMPEVTHRYSQDQDLHRARQAQLDILDAYASDFSKHAPKHEVIRINEVWQCLSSQLAKENKKFIYSKLKASARGREYETAIEWLNDAGLIHNVYNVNKPLLPLKAYVDIDAFKLYMHDVGLLCAMADISPKILIEGNHLFSQFNGAFIENYVAQTLSLTSRDLYYWTSKGEAELDYLLALDDQIFPLEVKSGSSRKKKSLQVYRNKHEPILSIVTSPANLKLDGGILNCPLYLLESMSKLIELAKT